MDRFTALTRTAFNKHETVDLLREEGLPVVKSVLVGQIPKEY